MSKTKKRLTRRDLESHFGFFVRELFGVMPESEDFEKIDEYVSVDYVEGKFLTFRLHSRKINKDEESTYISKVKRNIPLREHYDEDLDEKGYGHQCKQLDEDWAFLVD